MIDEKKYVPAKVNKDEWKSAKCDKYDFMIAAFCGGVAGLIDVFFVGDPLTNKLGKSVDKTADELVKKAAQQFWKNDKRTSGKPKKMPQSLEQCIGYLEQSFPVNYDARYAKDLYHDEGVLSSMSPRNHHLLSLAHSPDPIGLIFSIIDQFRGYATFVDKGKIIHLVPKNTSGAIPYMQGTDLPSMLFCGFVNWIGHLLSDLVGSSSTRRVGKTGRGAGIPMPFYELFLACEFGNIDGKTFAKTMTEVFENGYDLRFGVTMAIPVILEELMIKVIWTIRQKFIRKKTWGESFPSKEHADLRIMLLVGNGTLCLVDGVDATIEGINVVGFICHLNLVGWVRFITLILQELKIRFGPVIDKVIRQFISDAMTEIKSASDKRRIEEFYERTKTYDMYLEVLFREFVAQIEKEYQELYVEIEATFNEKSVIQERTEHSIKLAEISGVEEQKIIRNHKQLDDLFG